MRDAEKRYVLVNTKAVYENNSPGARVYGNCVAHGLGQLRTVRAAAN